METRLLPVVDEGAIHAGMPGLSPDRAHDSHANPT